MPSRQQQRVARQVEGLLSRMADMGRSPRYLTRLLKLAEVPLHPSGWGIITVLNREGPQSVSSLAELLNVDQSTASRQLKPLYEAGLVSRTVDPADRRSTIVATTEVGNTVFETVRRRWLDDLAWFMRDWRPDDRRRLGELAERFSLEIDAGRAQLSERDAASSVVAR